MYIGLGRYTISAWAYTQSLNIVMQIEGIPVELGSSISGPQAKSGPRRPNNWPAEQRQNAEEIYYNFFKVHLSVLTIYLFILIINERLILVKKISLVMQDAV